MSGFVPSAFFPVGAAALSGVTPPAATSEAVAAGGSVTGWTFSAFTDPDGRIASYSATLTAVVGSGSLSGSGLGPYSLTGTANGDSYTVELDALDGDGAVLATATHSVAIAASAAPVASGDFVMGGYLELDGVDERVNLGNVPGMEMQTGSNWSVSLWVRSNSVNNAWFSVTSASNSANLVFIYEDPSGQMAVVFKLGNDTYQKKKSSVLTEGQWQHVLVTSEGTGVRAWVNGVEITSWSSISGSYPTATETWDGTAEVWIGGARSTWSYYTAGKIAQVAMWSTDQSANVAAIYAAAGADLRELAMPPDVFYMPLSTYNQSETATDGVRDLGPNGYHGTGENMDGDELVGSNITSTPAYSWLDGGLTWKP